MQRGRSTRSRTSGKKDNPIVAFLLRGQPSCSEDDRNGATAKSTAGDGLPTVVAAPRKTVAPRRTKANALTHRAAGARLRRHAASATFPETQHSTPDNQSGQPHHSDPGRQPSRPFFGNRTGVAAPGPIGQTAENATWLRPTKRVLLATRLRWRSLSELCGPIRPLTRRPKSPHQKLTRRPPCSRCLPSDDRRGYDRAKLPRCTFTEARP